MTDHDDGHFGDLVGHVAQSQRAAPPPARPLTAADVRARMLDLISTLRAAEAIPFAPAEMKKHIAMFPIMAQWLDPEDGRQLMFDFDAEVERLLAA